MYLSPTEWLGEEGWSEKQGISVKDHVLKVKDMVCIKNIKI